MRAVIRYTLRVKKTTLGHFSLCCSNSKISLPGSRLPNEIFNLFTG